MATYYPPEVVSLAELLHKSAKRERGDVALIAFLTAHQTLIAWGAIAGWVTMLSSMSVIYNISMILFLTRKINRGKQTAKEVAAILRGYFLRLPH